jgi:hypothetical protein
LLGLNSLKYEVDHHRNSRLFFGLAVTAKRFLLAIKFTKDFGLYWIKDEY